MDTGFFSHTADLLLSVSAETPSDSDPKKKKKKRDDDPDRKKKKKDKKKKKVGKTVCCLLFIPMQLMVEDGILSQTPYNVKRITHL